MTKKGWIYPLPSNTQSVLVKYSPKWVISAVVPAIKRKILAVKRDFDLDKSSEQELEISVPSLIMSHAVQCPWIDYSKAEFYFNLNVINLDKTDDVYTTPYRLANIYPSGTICFGDLELTKKVANLRQANNYFWTSIFNEDNCPYTDIHYQDCKKRNHDHYDERLVYSTYATKPNDIPLCLQRPLPSCSCCINECSCTCGCDKTMLFFDWLQNYHNYVMSKQFTRSKALFCGDKYFGWPRATTAIFLTNKPELLELPENLKKQDFRNSDILLGAANRLEDKWLVEFDNQHTCELLDSEIEVMRE